MFNLELSELVILLLVVSFFTIVQSVFGVGLLVFGTPTLLLMGYSFPETLSYLLPPSIIVSFLQVYKGWNQIVLYRFNVIIYILPMVVIGLLLAMYYFKFNLHLIIGLMLLLTSLTRLSEMLNKHIESYLCSNFKAGFLFTGIIHGLTNLGGAPLVIITNGIYKKKKEIQPNIAYAYLFMASSQVITLFIIKEFIFTFEVLLLSLASGIIFLFLGKHIFEVTSDKLYYNIMSFFILVYGFLLIFKSL